MSSKIYGYARVSTKTQSIERQIRNILALYPDAVILKEAFTGTKVEGRTEFCKLLKHVQAGDTIVFDSVSRMSRNAEEGAEIYESLYNRGVKLVFIKEPYINTDMYKETAARAVPMTGTEVDCILKAVNEYMMILAKKQVAAAFEQAEKEVKDNHQRTKEGIETARLNGKQIGQQKGRKLTIKKAGAAKEKIKLYSRTFGGSMSDEEVLKLTGISKPTLYKYKKEIAAELEQEQREQMENVWAIK